MTTPPIEPEAGAEYVWDWQDDPPTYLVRRGSEVICTTNRFKAGYERAKDIADSLNRKKS